MRLVVGVVYPSAHCAAAAQGYPVHETPAHHAIPFRHPSPLLHARAPVAGSGSSSEGEGRVTRRRATSAHTGRRRSCDCTPFDLLCSHGKSAEWAVQHGSVGQWLQETASPLERRLFHNFVAMLEKVRLKGSTRRQSTYGQVS
jgi:hypothetical protein